MDEDTLKINLRTIKELVLDEDKLVTYTSLSKDLCIHVNEAKFLLNRILGDLRQSQPNLELNVCYVISGLLDNKSASTTVCSEAEIENLRKKLLVTFYEHIYSISKGTQSVDSVALAALNKFEDLSLCIGHIKDASCTKRTKNELSELRDTKLSLPVETKSNVSLPKPVKAINQESNRNGTIEVKKESNVQVKTEVKTEIPSPNKDLSTKNPPVKKNGVKPTNGIIGFFKQNGDTKKVNKCNGNPENDSSKENKHHDQKVEIKIERTDVETKSITNKVNSKNKKKSNKESNNSSTSSLSTIKQNAKVDKKRKRLLHVSDSESDTEMNDPFADEKMVVDHDSEDEIPPTPTVNTVKITSGMINPKKRRKIVDKTYTSEDGYILTKKEEVYESCSDNEEDFKEIAPVKVDLKVEEPVKQTSIKTETSLKEKNVKGKKKKVSPQKGKQSMMTNFFKKV